MSTTPPFSRTEPPVPAQPGTREGAQEAAAVQALSDWIVGRGLAGSDLVALIEGMTS